MAGDTFATNVLFTDYILPFLLIWVVTFAVLERSKLFGDSNKQLNSILALVVGLIFVGFVKPKEIATNMVLFLSLALIIILVFLLIYGFFAGPKQFFEISDWMKWVIAGLAFVSVFIAVLWAAGLGDSPNALINSLFGQSWSKAFWSNGLFIIVIAVVIALVVRTGKK